VKIDPVVLAKNVLIEIVLRVHVVVRCILSNIAGFTGPIFAICGVERLYARLCHAFLVSLCNTVKAADRELCGILVYHL